MSSENLSAHADDRLFAWTRDRSLADYVVAHYRLETSVEPERAAYAIAREQSACTTEISHVPPEQLAAHTTRVLDVRVTGTADADPVLPGYRLHTPVYSDPLRARGSVVEATLAIPVANLRPSVTSLINHAFGEVPRLGFLHGVLLRDLELPASYLAQFAGPRHGAAGLRDRLGIAQRPLFCRSTRPAVGQHTGAMVEIARAVLEGGFDMVKDDELTEDTPLSPVAGRWRAYADLIAEVSARSGERKLGFANVIDEQESRLTDLVVEAGLGGVLAAPGLNGFGVFQRVASRGLISIAHNTGSDVLMRAPRLGLSPQCWLRLCRIAGGDLVMLPGEFASGALSRDEERALVDALAAPLGHIAPSLPILAGGKRADKLGDYRERVGSDDFMLIVAAAVDHHPQGIAAGAREFRDAWNALAG
jgi:ribulose-bisphosphate carboxylase large chain